MTDAKLTDIAKLMGRKGGQVTYERYGKAHLSKAGKIGMAHRWANHKKKLSSK